MTHKKITKISLRKILVLRFFVFVVLVLILSFANTSYAFSISDLINGFKNYVSPTVAPVVVKKTTTTPPIKVISSNTGITESNINQIVLKLLNSPDIQAKFKGAKGDTGIPGVTTIQTVINSSPSLPQSNPVGYLPVGVTIPNATYNFSGGAYENIANLSSNIFTTNTANITDVTVSGSSTLKGGLTLSGDESVGGNLNVTGNTTLNNLNVTGAITGSIAGVLNPLLTNGSVLFQGASGITQDNANLFYNPTTHSLGIGTTTPSANLVVNSAVGGYNAIFSDGTHQVGIYLDNTYGGWIGTKSNHNLNFMTNNSNPQMVLATSGNVGIGTTSPTAKFQVTDSAYNFKISNTSGFQNYTTGVNAWANLGTDGVSSILSWYNSSNTLKGTIDVNGNLGIGINAPVLPLEVRGTQAAPANSGTTATGRMRLNGTDLIAMDFGAINSGSFPAWIQVHNSSNQATNYPLSLQPNGGNVGIGTANPSQLFQVGTTLYVDNANGKVGIGVTSPARNLELSGPNNGGEFEALRLTNSSSGGNSNVGMEFLPAGGVLTVPARIFATAPGASNVDLAFATVNGGTAGEKMRILGNGNVGIGTTTPTGQLHVYSTGASTVSTIENNLNTGISQFTVKSTGGANLNYFTTGSTYASTAYFGLGATNQAVLIANSATQFGLGTFDAEPIVFGTSNTERMRITATGNVGIGLANPGYALSVNGEINIPVGNRYRIGTAEILYSNGPATDLYIGGGTVDTRLNGTGNTGISVSGTALGSKFVVNGNASIGYGAGGAAPANGLIVQGNVGIGTTSPGQLLDVENAGSTQMYIGGAPAGSFGYTIGRSISTGYLDILGTQAVLSVRGINVNGGGKFTDTVSVNGNALISQWNSNIGVGNGTGTPSATLQVVGSNATFRISSDMAGTADYTITRNSTSGLLNFTGTQAGFTGYTFSGGNVGIGTTSPSAPLEVKGSGTGATIAKFTDVNTTGCTIATGGTISCSSDIRLKKNINDISYGLDTLMHLRPVTYNWNYQDDTTTPNLGFIAQEVQSIIPNLVTTDTSTGYEQLNTIGLVPVLTKSIQELNLNLESISNTITLSSGQTLSSTQQSFYDSFFGNVKKVITVWLADASNGIGKIFTGELNTDKVNTKQLCVGDVCVSQDQFLQMVNSASHSNVLPPPPTQNTAGQAAPSIGSTDPAIGTTSPDIGTTEPAIGSTSPDIGNTSPSIGTTSP